MALATPVKRIRLTQRTLDKYTLSPRKKNRLEAKIAFLKTLPAGAKFNAGPKDQYVGGWN